MNIQSILADTNSLPLLPATVLKLKDLLSETRPNPQEILELVTIDPILTAEILRISNKTFFTSSVGVATVQQAYSVVGDHVLLETLRTLLTENSLKQSINCIDLTRFWTHSVDTALVAREISSSLNIAIADNMFVSGLLLNLGEVVFASRHPNLARTASIDGEDEQSLPWSKQRALLGFTYAELTYRLIKKWKFPLSITEPINSLSNPANSCKAKNAHILHLAALAALAIGDSKYCLDSFITAFDLKAIGCSREQIELAVERANLEGFHVSSVLDPLSMVIL